MASSDSANRDNLKEPPEASSTSRYRFRSDLEIVRDGDAGADVTVVDPRTGERHAFTADEFLLCRSADGTNTLAAIRQAFKAETGREISHGKLFALVRRLRALGLFEEGGAETPDAGPSGTRPQQAQPDTSSGPVAQWPSGDDESLVIVAPSNVTGVNDSAPRPAAVEARAATPAATAAAPPPENKATMTSPAEPANPAAEAIASEDLGEKRRARRQRLMQSRWRADKTASAQAAAAPAKAQPKTPEASGLATTDAFEEVSAESGLDDELGDLESLALLETGRAPGRRGAPGGRRRRREGRRLAGGGGAGPIDEEGLGEFAGALGGGLGGGGLGGGGLGGGGLGGGGLGGGALGGLGGGGLGAGAMQNFLAGVAQRGRGRQQPEPEFEGKEPAQLSLFNPNAIFGALASPARLLTFVWVPILIAAAVAIGISYWQRQALTADIGALDQSVVTTAILALLIVNLFSRLTQATVIRSFGGEVNEFGIAVTVVVPRFYVDLGGIATLERRGQLWAYAAPLLARLALFAAGMLVWFGLRQSEPSGAQLALVVGQIAWIAFLLAAFPLLPSDGYRWLATYFSRPTLRAEALGTMPGRLPEAGDQGGFSLGGSPAIVLYVLALALGTSALALVGQVYFDVATSGNVAILTAVFLVGLCAALTAWAVAVWRYGRSRDIATLDPAGTEQVLATWVGTPDIASERPVGLGTIGKVFWAAVACALLAVAFLPYRYNPAGTFEILPAQRTVVAARTAGEILQVLVREGDSVKANQPLAKLSSDDQQREVTIARAELDRAKAQLAQLGGKSPDKDSDPGLDALNRSIAEALSDEPDSAAKKAPADSNYFKTQAERAARAEVERLTRKLAYARDQLADTTIRAPKDGRVVTPNVHLLTGTWLRRGSELLALDDTATLEAEINLPEADVGLVKVGDKVRLRPWSNEDREIAGTVTDIAPAAQARPSGTIVRVRASIPNSQDFLLPSMTGYAKIDGKDMRVWEAFLRRIIRIVRVEMWSWIP